MPKTTSFPHRKVSREISQSYHFVTESDNRNLPGMPQNVQITTTKSEAPKNTPQTPKTVAAQQQTPP